MSASTLLDRPRAGYVSTLAVLALGIVVLGGLFWPECRAAVRVWNESTAYGHCYLVVPIALYLAWDGRGALRGLVPRATPIFALLALPVPFIWLTAERLGIMEVRQFAGIAALEVLFLSILGWRLFRALSGPLLYLVFLVPFGAFLTPVLQSFTAWFIEIGLTVLGIPHIITDMTIEIAKGTFFVAEACAGLRFLIASVAFGVFFALLNYNSPGRRAAFIAASIIVPILANGMRALGIVVLGQILGDAQAAAADHLIYGWFFFSFVTLMLVLAGLPFREAPATAAAAPYMAGNAGRTPRHTTLAATCAVVLVLTAIGPAAMAAMQHFAPPVQIGTVPTLVAPEGCQIAPQPTASSRYGSIVWTMGCATRVWTVTLQVLPGMSTGAALAETRAELVGRFDDEEASVGVLPGAAPWRTTSVHKPALIAATAAWVGGRPASGGLAQRIALARNSLMPHAIEPVVMAVVYRSSNALGQAELDEGITELARFVAANPALDTEVARVTATSSRPPRS